MLEELLLSEAFQQLLQALLLAIATIATTLIGLGAKSFIAYLKTKTDDTTLGILKETAATVVRALAQSPATQLYDGARKKELALLWLEGKAEGMGLPVTFEDLDHILEEAVQVMKAEATDVWAQVPAYIPPPEEEA